MAKIFFKIDTQVDLIGRLKSDTSLRKICGFTSVPSAATLSRRMTRFADIHAMEQVLNHMVKAYHTQKLVGHISRDSTSIAAREKPANKKKDVAIKPKRKCGRPKKGEEKQKKEQKRLTRQISLKPQKALRELDSKCSWGCKKNSQGNI